MRFPPDELAEIMRACARETRVPWTMLAAVAHQESNYDPTVVGKKTAKGWRAIGLMQLSPDVLKANNLSESDALHAGNNCRAGARLLAQLYEQAGGKPDAWTRALAGYVFGWGKVLEYEAEAKNLPQNVRKYAQVVIGNRRWLQAQTKPNGKTSIERLARALHGLAQANQDDDQIRGLWTTFRTFWESKPGQVLAKDNLLSLPVLEYHWRAYARLYDRAPITDGNTPRPQDIDLSLWDELLRRAPIEGEGYQTTLPFTSSADMIRSIERGAAGSGGFGLVVLGVLLLIAAKARK
jgi:Transglycosylase SLT domain